MDLSDLLKFSVDKNASDLHLSTGMPPLIRVDGHIRRIEMSNLKGRTVLNMAQSVMTEDLKQDFEREHEIDFATEIKGLARFRVNVFQQVRGPSAVFRTIPSKVLTLDDLKAPSVLYHLTNKPRGLILVTGPTGSGKSTTLAAMLDLINQRHKGHILTIEDPVEFVHTPKNCIVNQRELGPHTKSFAAALRSALREDPDTILVGEMRDPETIHLALTAAETGHLVMSTLHTNSAAKAIDRIIDTFSANDKSMVRAMLSESIQAIVAQNLIPRVGGGRVAAHEILIGTNAVRNLIRENKIPQLYSALQTGQSVGMQTMDHAMIELVERNLVLSDDVMAHMKDPTKLPNAGQLKPGLGHTTG